MSICSAPRKGSQQSFGETSTIPNSRGHCDCPISSSWHSHRPSDTQPSEGRRTSAPPPGNSSCAASLRLFALGTLAEYRSTQNVAFQSRTCSRFWRPRDGHLPPRICRISEIIAIGDKAALAAIGASRTAPSQAFIRENHAQLSFSEGELMQKKTGLLATMFPVLGGFRMQNRRIPMRVTDVDRRRN